jgi:hypothetical protein
VFISLSGVLNLYCYEGTVIRIIFVNAAGVYSIIGWSSFGLLPIKRQSNNLKSLAEPENL